jgi:hypothetical protein
MSRDEYFSIREDIGIQLRYNEYLDAIFKIYDVYPNLRECTLTQIKEYFQNKSAKKEIEIQKRLNVL